MKNQKTAATAARKDTEATDLSLIVLTDIYNRYTQQPFDVACADLNGLGELIAHHPGLKEEAAALLNISAGEKLLNRLRRRTENL